MIRILPETTGQLFQTEETDVISFDLKTIVLETVCGMMVIKGHDLHVNRLSVDKGELDISGTIDGINYSDVNSYAKKSESLLSRLFK